MIIYLLLIVLLILLLLLLKWICQPYFAYKENLKKSSNENVVVRFSKNKTVSYGQYIKDLNKEVDVSLVIPAYNEEKRLGTMLKKTLDYFLKQESLKFEVIVINDCSKDRTTDVALDFLNYNNQYIDLKVIEYPVNKGKGGAIRMGMFASKGNYSLMVDADGATDINDFKKIFDTMKKVERNGHGIVVGSRAHAFSEVKRTPLRLLLSGVSKFIIRYICGLSIKDTQCGFKLFTKQTAFRLFSVMHLERWSFDVELFIIGKNFDIPAEESPVNWRDVEGSHLNPLDASLTMTRDFLLVRMLYLLKVWKITDKYQFPRSYGELIT